LSLLELLGFTLFEPAHFLMQRKMLLTLKGRAEHPSSRTSAWGTSTPDEAAQSR
jgi:hypothetical protein